MSNLPSKFEWEEMGFTVPSNLCGTFNFDDYNPERLTPFLNEICGLASIGAAWRKDSSLAKWFPITDEELKLLKARHDELYKLVELYLTVPNTGPAVKDHYDNLCAWFASNKRPDGSEPLPIAGDQ